MANKKERKKDPSKQELERLIADIKLDLMKVTDLLEELGDKIDAKLYEAKGTIDL